MLKLLPSNTFITANAKCAEVYCQSSPEFMIICEFCKMKIFDFNDFLIHFKNLHIKNDLLKADEIEIKSAPYVEVVMPNEEQLLNADLASSLKEEFEILLEPQQLNEDDGSSAAQFSDNDEGSNYGNDSDNSYKPEDIDSQKKRISREKPHRCSECGKSYVGAPHLQAHIKKEHDPAELPESDKVLSCKQCGQKFSDQRRLDVHYIYTHGGIPCDQCPKKFKYRYELNRHYPIHTGVRSFECNFVNCTKKFFTAKSLATHKKSHRSEKAYVCDQCAYSCHEAATLRLHMRCHTGEKPFPCPICQKCFRSKALLNDHTPMHSKERPHVCDICGATFAHRKTLYHHKPLHSDVKKFVCKICDSAFRQAAGLAGHMRKHKEGLL